MFRLLQVNGFVGAYALAGSALYTVILVDDVLGFPFADAASRAFVSANAAGYATVGNDIH